MNAKLLMAAGVAALLSVFGHIPARADELPQPQTTSAEQIIDGSGTLYDGADEWA